jgi:hypothetical protein
MKRGTGEFNTKDTKAPSESEGDKPRMKTNQENDQAPMTMREARSMAVCRRISVTRALVSARKAIRQVGQSPSTSARLLLTYVEF